MEQLFELYRPLLLYLADRRLRGPLRPKVGASDIVQLTEWKARQAFAAQTFANRQGFHAWLLTILDHQVADVGRRYVSAQKRDVTRERPLSSPEAQGWLRELSARLLTRAAQPNSADSLEQVLAALQELPPHYQLVLRLRYFEAKSFLQIGDQIERPPDAARMLHNRAIARLRSIVIASESDDSSCC